MNLKQTSENDMSKNITVSYPGRQSIVSFTSTGPTVRIGGCLLRQLADDSLWLENEIGEGMQVKPQLIESCLMKFMAKHF